MKRAELEQNGLCGLVFDCDGVMIDSVEANRGFYNLVFQELGLPPITPEQEKFAFMATAQQALLAIVPKELHPRIAEAVSNVNYERDVLARIKLMPGFRDFMEHARERGFLLAIDTNRTTEGIGRVLDFFDLRQYFDPVICCTNSPPKPSPVGMEKICAAWNTQPERVLLIGDSEVDRQTAKNSGVLFAAFGNEYLKGDLQAPNFEILAKMLAYTPALRRHDEI